MYLPMAGLIGSLEAMQYQILLQKPSEQYFVASVIGLSNVVADGKTEKEAIAKVKAALKSQLAKAKFVTVEIDTEEMATPPQFSTEKLSMPKSIGLGNSERGDLSERVDELLWQGS